MNKPKFEYVDIDMMHAPLQFTDAPRHQQEDIAEIFRRAAQKGTWWITGTEAGERVTREALNRYSTQSNFWLTQWESVWVAVNRKYVSRARFAGNVPVLPGGHDHGPRGIAYCSFYNSEVGSFVSVGSGHNLTRGRDVKEMARAAGKWAKQHGAARGLAFYASDQNLNDRRMDTFYGEPLTSIQDELGKHEDTGHGPIDVIATYNGDKRVKARYVRVLDDREFSLHLDHFPIEAGVRVAVPVRQDRI